MSHAELIGSSPKFRAVLEDVQVVAPADCAVLLQGETGTGKEVIARAIHDASPRRHQRFVAVNCAAIPAALLESELFGHERGAFTGAVAQRLGRFQAADRGTLFLDEIGELPIELQPKLLRAIQEQELERLGSSQTVRVDVRIVAATNQSLEKMVAERRFRMDLYYRLNVFPITLPPLRERAGDIRLLVHHFLRTVSQRQGKTIEFVPEVAMAAMEKYQWPGNIRELQNFVDPRGDPDEGGGIVRADCGARGPGNNGSRLRAYAGGCRPSPHQRGTPRDELGSWWTARRCRATRAAEDHPDRQDAKARNFARDDRFPVERRADAGLIESG
jgi:transcriptional regulator with GAF, ATPase, and Fis domain